MRVNRPQIIVEEKMHRFRLKCADCDMTIGYMSLWVDGDGSDLKCTQHNDTCEPIRCTTCEASHNLFINAMTVAEEENVKNETSSSEDGTERA